MVSAEVQRTLVKSPPELWSELSDPASLARHLGELGEIRITRTDPEKRVDWEAEDATGTVAIKPSGWGTRVTLTLRRRAGNADGAGAPGGPPAQQGDEHDGGVGVEAPIAQPDALDGAAAPEEPLPADLEPSGLVVDEPDEPGTTPDTGEVAAAEPPDLGEELHDVEASAAVPAPAPAPRRSLWSRLFRRRRAPQELAVEHEPTEATPQEPDGAEAEGASHLPQPATAAAQAARHDLDRAEPMAAGASAGGEAHERHATQPRAETSAQAMPGSDVDAPGPGDEQQPVAVEDAAVQAATALLSGVLDRLGAAHHRPFSRP